MSDRSAEAVQLWFTALRKVELREQRIVAGPAQLLVRTLCSAVSAGTEMLVYRGQIPSDMALDASLTALQHSASYPLQYGYACVGMVESAGNDNNASWVGKLVFSFQPHATYFAASPEQLIELPSGIYEEDAVFLPNMDTAVNLIHDGAPLLGENVVILGQGVVGLLLSALLAKYPLGSLAAVDSIARRQQEALRMGAHSVHGSTESDIVALRKQLQRDAAEEVSGADLVFEVSGSPQALNTAIDLCGFSSRVVVGSWYGDKSAPLALGGAAHRNRISFVTSQVSTIAPKLSGRWDKSRRHGSAWQMIREVRPQQLITHRVPLEEAASLYTMLDQDPEAVLQAIFIYD